MNNKPIKQRPIKTAGYFSRTLRHRREQRSIEAEERQAKHIKLTIRARLEKCANRRGESKREIAKLRKRLEFLIQKPVLPVLPGVVEYIIKKAH